VGVQGHCYVWSHTTRHTSHSVGLIRTRDRPVADTSSWQDIERHAHGEIRNRNSSKRAAADPRLRPRGHGHWLCVNIGIDKYIDLLCNTAVRFYCNTVTYYGLLQNHHQVVEVSLRGDTTRYTERGIQSIICLTNKKGSPEYILKKDSRLHETRKISIADYVPVWTQPSPQNFVE
jgi:hypothetical protein